jgi:hypothetical protein
MSDVYLRESIREVAKLYCGSGDYFTEMIGDALAEIVDRADAKDEEHERRHNEIINEIGQF